MSIAGIPAARPTVIALHASAGSRKQWAPLAELVSGDMDVVAPNLIGHGDAPQWHNSGESIVTEDAARISQLARAVPGGAHLVGHSYGGAVALRVALDHPESVASVTVYEPVAFRVLVEFGRRSAAAAEVLEIGRFVRASTRSGDNDRAAARFVDYWNGSGAWSTLSGHAQRSIAATMPVVAEQFAGLIADGPRLADYRLLEMPVQLLAGAKMRTPMRRIIELLRFRIWGASSKVMPGMGHMGPVTHADAVAHAIRASVVRHATRSMFADRLAA